MFGFFCSFCFLFQPLHGSFNVLAVGFNTGVVTSLLVVGTSLLEAMTFAVVVMTFVLVVMTSALESAGFVLSLFILPFSVLTDQA